MINTRLSPHFELSEFVVSQTASRLGRSIVVDPDTLIAANLQRLCLLGLEPARALLGRPIIISSGYRPPWLNLAIGGSKRSQHMQGLAVDFVAAGLSVKRTFELLKASPIPFDQLILEYGRWIHMSISGVLVPPRRQVLTVTRTREGVRWTEHRID